MVNKTETNDREVSDKKRRKTSVNESSPTKLSREDLYAVSIDVVFVYTASLFLFSTIEHNRLRGTRSQ